LDRGREKEIQIGGNALPVPKGTNEYAIGLRPRMGILTIRAQDAATGQALVAEIVVDGKVVGKTPKSASIPLVAGEIVLRAPDHAEATVTERPPKEGGKISVVAKLASTKAEIARPAVAESPKALSVRAAAGAKAAMASIPAGCFQMGSTEGDNDETPVHQVCLDAFGMDRYDVTQGAYRQATGDNPSEFDHCGDDCPVENLGWKDAKSYCERLGKHLPTEAQWEYAARAGTATKWYWGNDEGKTDQYAWYAANSGKKTHPVGKKLPNAWGLYDMAGNVDQWTMDVKGSYSDESQRDPVATGFGFRRMARGGGWRDDPSGVRTTMRYSHTSSTNRSDLGFRCVSP